VKLLSVGLTGTTDEVRSRLQNDCITLNQEGFRVAIDEMNKGNYTFLGCNVIEGELSFRNYERIKNLLKNYVATILAEIIVVHEEKKIVRRIIDHNYYYFNDDEREIIYSNALKMLSSNSIVEPNFNFVSRRNTVLTKIIDYLDTHHELVVEGFINFRLKDYREQLVDIVDRAVDDFMMELEYQEFISVLRYFVDVQEPRIDEVHVVIGSGGTYKVLDSFGKTINNQYLENFATQCGSEINYEDLLITALITLAPYTIMLHNANQDVTPSVLETIKSVFDGRVIMCGGCEMCLETIQS